MQFQRILLAVDVARPVVVDLAHGFQALLENLAERIARHELDFLGDGNGLLAFIRCEGGLVSVNNIFTGYFRGVAVAHWRAAGCGIVVSGTSTLVRWRRIRGRG